MESHIKINGNPNFDFAVSAPVQANLDDLTQKIRDAIDIYNADYAAGYGAISSIEVTLTPLAA